jgi:hypothetical protein
MSTLMKSLASLADRFLFNLSGNSDLRHSGRGLHRVNSGKIVCLSRVSCLVSAREALSTNGDVDRLV